MSQEKIFTDKTPQISIADCQGDLVIRSWSENAVLVKGDNFDLEQGDSGISVTSPQDLKLMIPEGSSLSILNVSGDLVIKYVSGHISIQEAHRDAVLVGLGPLKINTIHSDLSAKNIDGDLSVEMIHGDSVFRNVQALNLGTVSGDISIRNASGDVAINEAMGDINLRTVNGDVTITNGQRDVNLRNLGGKASVTNIHGDIRIVGGLSADKHTFQAERDIILRWPLDAPLNLTANAPAIKNRLPLEAAQQTDNSLTGRIGDGETAVTLTANGRILLKETQVIDSRWEGDATDSFDFDFGADLEGLGAQISSQILNKFSQVASDLDQRFGPDFTQRISERITHEAERAAAKAERAAQQAAAKAERAAEQARRRAERNMRRSPGRPPAAPKPPAPPKRKASGEEQLKILKMVEQGIITPAEAATLLEALEN
ncbi:MAG: DUF4097 family beta strand repeat protein [Anaerolineales bacterium]|nr:DUF4097 family beta strand repeat protein [Anaerolineales bacterium]